MEMRSNATSQRVEEGGTVLERIKKKTRRRRRRCKAQHSSINKQTK
jgi:hypothetical protein